MQEETAREHAALLRIVAHPIRLMVLDELAAGMKCVNHIGEILEVAQPNVSQHLAVLKDGGLVTCHKDGTARCYRLAKPGLVKDLFGMLRKDYPVAKVGDPEHCRAIRNTPRRPRTTRRKRAPTRS